ncbi:MAG: phytoene/squalene synthase family protein [Pseudomonadota bacterium]
MNDLVEASRVRIERGSKSFATAARLFDRETRASAYMLYAWCRHCDDEIDGQDFGYDAAAVTQDAARVSLQRLRSATAQALAGGADHEVFRALQHVVDKHQIPHKHPYELLDGFEMDVDGRVYHTIDDTLDYSYHVAGVVGVMMAMVMGVRDRPTLNRASDLGIAFQLTNIARDIVPDAQVGRVYLPSEWLQEAGLTAADIGDPQHRAQLYPLAERLLDTADEYYESALSGIAQLPGRAAWAIAAARNVYRDIGRVIRSRGPRAWDDRVYVGRTRKLTGIALGGLQASVARLAPGAPDDERSRDGLWTRPDLGDA